MRRDDHVVEVEDSAAIHRDEMDYVGGELVGSHERALQGLFGEEQVGAVELDRRMFRDHTDDGRDAPLLSMAMHCSTVRARPTDRLEGEVHASLGATSVLRLVSGESSVG